MPATMPASVFEPYLGRRSELLDLAWHRCAVDESFKAWLANERNEWTDDLYAQLAEGAD